MHPHIDLLLQAIDLEEKEQANRYRLDEAHSLKQLKLEGLALHPVSITRRSFGFADYPEFSFRLPHPGETSGFRDGSSIECFVTGEPPVKGMLMDFDGKSGMIRLFAPDYPDWIEDRHLAVKLAPDTRTTGIMRDALKRLDTYKNAYKLFEAMHGGTLPASSFLSRDTVPEKGLNASQQAAVQAIKDMQQVLVVHGPPGTGKTTTLAAAIARLVDSGKKIMVSAPSNTAVDHLSLSLVHRGIRLLRVGNTGKVVEALLPHTTEGKLSGGAVLKEIKTLKKRADEFRRMALKYKRQFGKAEREQRQLLFREVKNIRNEIRALERYHEEKFLEEASVVAGTPIGLYDEFHAKEARFDYLVIDEAGQCLEPLAWCIIPFAEKIVLAGDHWQLPPTVLSIEAARKGLNISILEQAIRKTPSVHLLNTQYRMKPSIAGFSSHYFYEGALLNAAHLVDAGIHLQFIDTAGTGFEESYGRDGSSLENEGEIRLINRLIAEEKPAIDRSAFISPYAAQVTLARESFPTGLRCSTIDSFQGQEMETIIVSLVRSNDKGEIGFLRDYRRMNVALTRAKENLYIIGDSATVGRDFFFAKLIEYAESIGGYRTAWEFQTD
jgi:superfamily I DNA and/or RNA helicase